MDRMCSLQKAEMSELEAVFSLPGAGEAQERRMMYEAAAKEKRLHVLRANGSDAIAGAVVIGDAANAQGEKMRLDALAASDGIPGAREAMLSACELIAGLRGRKSMIIACPKEDEALAAFCVRQGFLETGSHEGERIFERAIEQGCHCGG